MSGDAQSGATFQEPLVVFSGRHSSSKETYHLLVQRIEVEDRTEFPWNLQATTVSGMSGEAEREMCEKWLRTGTAVRKQRVSRPTRARFFWIFERCD